MRQSLRDLGDERVRRRRGAFDGCRPRLIALHRVFHRNERAHTVLGCLEHLPHRRDRPLTRRARLVDASQHAAHHLLRALRRLGGHRSEPSYFARDHGESLAMLAGARGFHRGIECEQLRLSREFLHEREEAAYLERRRGETLDRRGARADVLRQHREGA